jgi:hypothetical protein
VSTSSVRWQHFDPEETFVSLEETIHYLVAGHGPIAVPEIVKCMAEERKVHDAGIALIGLLSTGAILVRLGSAGSGAACSPSLKALSVICSRRLA